MMNIVLVYWLAALSIMSIIVLLACLIIVLVDMFSDQSGMF